MLDSEKPLVCIPEAEVSDLLRRSRRTSGIIGAVAGFVSALAAPIVAALIIDAAHIQTPEEKKADALQTAAADFRDRVYGPEGYIQRLKNAASDQDDVSEKLAHAILAGDSVHVPSFTYGTTDASGYKKKLSSYLGVIDEIGRAIGSNAQTFHRPDLVSFATYRNVLANTAQDNFDCLAKLATAYRPTTYALIHRS